MALAAAVAMDDRFGYQNAVEAALQGSFFFVAFVFCRSARTMSENPMAQFMQSVLLPSNVALLDVFIVDDNATSHSSLHLSDSTLSTISSHSSSRWDSCSQCEHERIDTSKRSCPPKIPRRRTSSHDKHHEEEDEASADTVGNAAA